MEIKKQNLKQKIYISKEIGNSYNGDYLFNLEEWFFVWALIKAKKTNVFYGHDSYKNIGNATYDIYIKKNPLILLTSNAWLIQKPRISVQRNFKVIDLFEYNSDLICASCNLINEVQHNKPKETVDNLGDYSVDGLL